MILQMMVQGLLGSWFLFDTAGRFVYAEFFWHDVRFSLACVYASSVTQIEMHFSFGKIGHTETSERSVKNRSRSLLMLVEWNFSVVNTAICYHFTLLRLFLEIRIYSYSIFFMEISSLRFRRCLLVNDVSKENAGSPPKWLKVNPEC